MSQLVLVSRSSFKDYSSRGDSNQTEVKAPFNDDMNITRSAFSSRSFARFAEKAVWPCQIRFSTTSSDLVLPRTSQSFSTRNRQLNGNLERRSQLHTAPRRDLGNPAYTENDAIRAFKVTIVQGDGTLGEPILLQDALQKRKRDEAGNYLERLRQVRDPDRSLMFPVCRYFNIKAEQEKERAQRKAQREQKSKGKHRTVNLNWTISEHDLGHWMGRVKEFLKNGSRVDVIVGSTTKPGWRLKKAEGPEEARKLIEKIENMAREVGSSKVKEDWRGRADQEVALTFDPPKRS